MKFYYCYTITYYKNELIYTDFYKEMCDEKPFENMAYNISWDNLNEILPKIEKRCGFGVWNNSSKGHRVVSFNNKLFHDIKEWTTSNLDITVKTLYNEMTPTLKEIFEYHDSNKAIKYLCERGGLNLLKQ